MGNFDTSMDLEMTISSSGGDSLNYGGYVLDKEKKYNIKTLVLEIWLGEGLRFPSAPPPPHLQTRPPPKVC